MIDLKRYRENAQLHGMCSEYSLIWDSCMNKKQIMDMALGCKALDFLCDSIGKGWGISPERISSQFSSFINGKYTSFQKGYDSEMYCRYEGEITLRTTVLGLIECRCTIVVPKNSVCRIFITKNSDITVKGEGRCVCVCYGTEDEIKVNIGNSQTKIIHKLERDSNE